MRPSTRPSQKRVYKKPRAKTYMKKRKPVGGSKFLATTKEQIKFDFGDDRSISPKRSLETPE